MRPITDPQILHDETHLERGETLRVLIVAGGLQRSPKRGATTEPDFQVAHGSVVRGSGEIAQGQLLLAVCPDLERFVCVVHKNRSIDLNPKCLYLMPKQVGLRQPKAAVARPVGVRRVVLRIPLAGAVTATDRLIDE